MKIAFHGGKCCGVKIIHGFIDNDYPLMKHMENELEETVMKCPDEYGHNVSSETNCYYQGAPEETSLDRLDRYLAFLEEWRPQGIIEIILISSQSQWFPVIQERGFKEVSNCMNGNSGNRIYVFHKCIDEESK